MFCVSHVICRMSMSHLASLSAILHSSRVAGCIISRPVRHVLWCKSHAACCTRLNCVCLHAACCLSGDTAARHLRVCVLRVDQVHRDCMICRRRHCVCRPNVLREIRRLLQPPYTLMLASWACRTLPPCAIIGSRIVCECRVVQSSGAQHGWHTQRLDATYCGIVFTVSCMLYGAHRHTH